MKHWYIILEDKVMTMVLFFNKEARDEWIMNTQSKIWKTGFAKHIALDHEDDHNPRTVVLETQDAGELCHYPWNGPDAGAY